MIKGVAGVAVSSLVGCIHTCDLLFSKIMPVASYVSSAS